MATDAEEEVTTINIRLARDCIDLTCLSENATEMPHIFLPGETVTTETSFMKGHGTYIEDDEIKSSLAGVMEQMNRLISVKPFKSRYIGEIGDVVVARIIGVQQKRWRVDTNSHLDSVLLLSSVNLPGGELRRRGAEDEQMMRKYLQEGDLISAEVQSIFEDGSLSLYTRSLKYGKLSKGLMVKVFPSLIKPCKTHFHNLPCGASIILGNNGFIWISAIKCDDEAGETATDATMAVAEMTRSDREVIARLRNCILALARCKIILFDTSILYAYEDSLKYEAKDLLLDEVMLDIALSTKYRLCELEE